MSGEDIIYFVLTLLADCLNLLKRTVLLTFNGKSLTLWNFLVFFFGLSIVMDLFAIWAGGSPGDDFNPEDDYYDF